MKYKTHILTAAIATLAASCNNSSNSKEVAGDTLSVETSTNNLAVDTAVIQPTPAIDSIATDTVAKKVEAPKADNNNLDAEVDKIIAQINEHTNALQGFIDDGIPPTSSIAFRVLQNLPDYTKKLNKIKGKLTPEQKARIDAAEKKLNKLQDSWN